MSQQLLLPDIPDPPPPTDNHFWALRPEPDSGAGRQIDRLARTLRDQQGLVGLPLGPNRFHVTLHPLRSFLDPHRARLDEACRAVAETTAPFEVVFDRIASFAGGTALSPVVLWGGPNDALQDFRRQLGIGLMRGGLGRFETGKFTPHVTLLYDRRTIPEQNVEPVSWTVTEFFLVQSLWGEGKHIMQGRWPFPG